MKCINCGKETKKWGAGYTKYCSEKCHYDYWIKISKKHFEKINCAICGKEFMPKMNTSKYCSTYCKIKSGSLKRSKKPITKVCKFCGKEFSPYTSLDKFCSANCRVDFVKSKRTKNWKKESIDGIKGVGNPCYRNGLRCEGSKQTSNGLRLFKKNSSELRNEVLEEHGYMFCQHCGVTEKKLEAHHIIFRSEKPNHENLHDKINIILCCVKCHNLFHKDKSTRNKIVEDRGIHILFGNDVLDK